MSLFDVFKRRADPAEELITACFEAAMRLRTETADLVAGFKAAVPPEKARLVDNKSALAFLAVCELAVRRRCSQAKRNDLYEAFGRKFGPGLHEAVGSMRGNAEAYLKFFDVTLRGLLDFTPHAEMSEADYRVLLTTRGYYLASRIAGMNSNHVTLGLHVADVENDLEARCDQILAKR